VAAPPYFGSARSLCIGVFEAVEAVMAPALAPTKPPAALVDVTGKLVEL
jgi:hypothetical protein